MRIIIQEDGKEAEIIDCNGVLVSAYVTNERGDHTSLVGFRGEVKNGIELELLYYAKKLVSKLLNFNTLKGHMRLDSLLWAYKEKFDNEKEGEE